MKGRSELWRAVHDDLVDKCAATAPQSVTDSYKTELFRTAKYDVKTVVRRANNEGDEFFTLSLPTFGKEFLMALDRGCLLRSDFPGWRRRSYVSDWSSEYDVTGPSFLSWALQIVFAARHTCSAEPDSLHPCLIGEAWPWRDYPGRYTTHVQADDEAEEWAAESVHAILQLSRLYSKEKQLASPARCLAALDQYVTTDGEIADHLEQLSAEGDFPQLQRRLERVRKVITLCFAPALSKVDRMVYDEVLLPKHGPGATADKLVGNEKWFLTEWTERLQVRFPWEVYLYANDSILRESDDSVHLLAPEDERPSKVILVPKTQATPRVIAIEPTCMQYVQQGFQRALVPVLESNSASKHFVGFTDQGPNRRAAAYGSAGGGLATLDLSEASDRVANWLVEELFADFPHFLEGIQACRSTHASLPDGRLIPLNKYASMGSALTFPIEAMVFAAIVIEAVCQYERLPLNQRSMRGLWGKVRVFGDDIICPQHLAEDISDSLEFFGFRVNRHKSFWTGEFRESCGEEYWRGRDVSTVKIREPFPTDIHSAKELISTSSTRNQFFEAGFVSAVDFLDGILLKVTRGDYPVVEETSPLLGRRSLDRPSGDSWDPTLHVPVAKGYVVVAKSPVNKLDGPRALLKYFLNPSEEDEHLTRSGRPRAVRMKLVMAPVF